MTSSTPAGLTEPSEEAQTDAAPAAPEAEDPGVARLLEHLPDEGAARAPAEAPIEAPPALRTAHVVSMKGRALQIAWRGRRAPVEAELDEGVDRELIERAMKNGDAVLVESEPGATPIVVGVVQTRIPEVLEIKASQVIIEGEREVLVRSGRGAMRIREDGDVEVVGSRISTMSRGLFRIVGRVLRLN